jgi:NAD(P)-dependent dehydrogenase (short-subunit alcohol dehydrogenase family)
VTYHAIDLAGPLSREPAAFRPALANLLGQFSDDELQVLPSTSFPLERAGDAFRYMAQARHIGKVVVVPPARSRVGIRPDGTYLVTGGLRGLGLLVAEWLVEQGARHLTLIGRRGPTEEAERLLGELGRCGAAIRVEQADVSQEEALAAVIRRMTTEGPPLRGVVHSAGVLDDGVILQQDWSRFAGVMAPKVQGSWNLHRLTADVPLDFFVLFSSAAAVLGSPGQANHAAANAFLDALAHHRRARGLPASSINWGVWSEIGAAADRGVPGRATLQGLGSLSPDQGLEALERVLGADSVQTAVIPASWATLVRASPLDRAFLSELLGEDGRGADTRSSGAGPAEAPSLRTRLESAAPGERPHLLREYVRELATRVLQLDPGEVLDVHQPLNEMGLDSLMAVELRNLVGAGLELDRSLPATLVFDHPSIVELADYLGREALGLGNRERGEDRTPAGTGDLGDLLDSIEQLSENEVELRISRQSEGSQ